MADLTATNIPPKSGRLVYIQYLRGLAAMMVVLHHALSERVGFYNPLTVEPDFGRPGVLIFFVISGFIMMHACRNEPPMVFARRRIIRVVPLYWVMTLIFVAILVRNDVAADDPMRRLPELIQSLVFIPHYHTGVPTEIWPILVPGWTLNYEMFFFVIFTIGIALGMPARVTCVILLVLVCLGAVHDSEHPLWRTWTSGLLVLFMAGIALAHLWEKTDFSRISWMFPAGLLMVFLAAMQLIPEQWIDPFFYFSAVMTVAGTLALQDKSPGFSMRPLAAMGDASYSIYLSHTILMIFLYKALRLVPITGWMQFCLVLVSSLTICAAVGYLIYRLVERPMIRALRSRYDPFDSLKQGK